jgi:hypothetical protein
MKNRCMHTVEAKFPDLKLDRAGAYQWHTFYGSDDYDSGYGIASLDDGSIYIAGSSRAGWLGDGDSNPIHPYCENCLNNIAILKLWDRSSTNIELVSTPNPSAYGQDVTFTATIYHTWNITPTGLVTFTEGDNLLGTGMVNPVGVATYITSTLEIGEHVVSAEYSGDESYYGSISTPLTHTVNRANTLSSLVSYPNPSVYGESITITATVSSASGITPTGVVTFTQDGSPLGTGNLDGSGKVALVIDSLAAGAHAITAEYGGDAVHAGSTSAPLVHVVNKAVALLALISSPNPSIYGESVTFTTTITS